jgi:hypothetical protein
VFILKYLTASKKDFMVRQVSFGARSKRDFSAAQANTPRGAEWKKKRWPAPVENDGEERSADQ